MASRETNIALGILEVWYRMKSNIERMANENDLAITHVFLLYNLYKTKNLIMGDIARRLHCDASNVTNLVDKLEQRGLIMRSDVPGDRRAKHIVISASGKEFIDHMLQELPKNTGIDDLASDEIKNFEEILLKLQKHPQ